MDNIETVKTQLKELKPKLSEQDRMFLATDLKCNIRTIYRYLGGEVKKEAFGLELLAKAKEIVQKREKALA